MRRHHDLQKPEFELDLMGRRVTSPYLRSSRMGARCRQAQNAIYTFLERPRGLLSCTYHVIVFLLIFVCLLLSVLTSVDSERQQVGEQNDTTLSELPHRHRLTLPSSATGKVLHRLEILLVTVFSVEFILRVWSAGCRSRFQSTIGRLRYLKQPFTCLDLFICISSLVIITTGTTENQIFATSALRGLRFLQVLRIVRMDRRGGTWRLLGSVIYLHRQELVTTFYIGFLGLIFASMLMYHLENQHPPPANEFETYADCLWWGIVTLTTVGYGDKVPESGGGKLVASFFAVMGISFFALPAGILGSGFALKVQEQQRQKHFARRRHPAATLIQCLWRCYACSEDSLSVATWLCHVAPPAHAPQPPPPARKRAGSFMERIPTRRNAKDRALERANNQQSTPVSPDEVSSPQQLRPDMQCNGLRENIRKPSILSLNFEAYFPTLGLGSTPNSRKNSMNESESVLAFIRFAEEAPRRLTKLRPKHKTAIRFIRRMKFFRARIKFKEALKPYDVKDVIEQYAAGHVDLVTRVKDIQTKFALIVGSRDKKKQESSFSKMTMATRVVKIEGQLTHLERKLDHLINMYRKDKISAAHALQLQQSGCSSGDENPPGEEQRGSAVEVASPLPSAPGTPLSPKPMHLLSPVAARSRSHSQPNALDTTSYLGTSFKEGSAGKMFNTSIHRSSPVVSRAPSTLKVPQD